jgi:oligopeptide transport system ATP-binding protein
VTEPLLKVRGLEKRFPGADGRWLGGRGGRLAVAGVDLDLHRGRTLGLVGESGCGKSTLARAILRLVEPTAGAVVFDGEDVGAMDRRALRSFRTRAQIVFQDPVGSLNPRLAVGAVLAEALAVHGTPAARRRGRALELMELVGLGGEHLNRYPHELSGGQRQRVGIARALSVQPELLVLDEPVSALDVSVQAQVLNLLADLRRELDLTCLFIAHDLAVVERVSDRVAVMYAGRIVEVGSRQDVYERPRHPYTRALLAAVPRAKAGRRGRSLGAPIEGDGPEGAWSSGGCPFHPRCQNPLKDPSCLSEVPCLDRQEGSHRVACFKAPSEGRNGG